MALTFAPHFMDKFIETLRPREVHVRIRFDAMPVTAADHQLVPLARQSGGFAVLFPIPEAVQFEGVDELSVNREEIVHQHLMLLCPDAVEIPERMVEDDEYTRDLIEFRQHLGEELWWGLFRGHRRKMRPAAPSRLCPWHSEG